MKPRQYEVVVVEKIYHTIVVESSDVCAAQEVAIEAIRVKLAYPDSKSLKISRACEAEPLPKCNPWCTHNDCTKPVTSYSHKH